MLLLTHTKLELELGLNFQTLLDFQALYVKK